MSNSLQFKTGVRRPVKTIVNGFSSGGTHTQVPTASVMQSLKETLSGALTANTLATALSITGAGSLEFLCLGTKDTTARTVRMKITLDGNVAFDSTSDSVSTANYGIIGVGFCSSNSSVMDTGDIYFNVSCLVEIASSLSETDKISIRYQYKTF